MSSINAFSTIADSDVAEIVRFGLASVQSSAALFFWVDDGRTITEPQFTGVEPQYFTQYTQRVVTCDPLNMAKMAAKKLTVAQLSAVPTGYDDRLSHYKNFLMEYGVLDVVDLVFWSGGIPVAGLALLKLRRDPPVSTAQMETAHALQRYVEHNLHRHHRLTRLGRQRWLRETYQLTAREIDVAERVAEGRNNASIARELNISLPTVKTHLLRILAKTDCQNRTQLGVRIAES